MGLAFLHQLQLAGALGLLRPLPLPVQIARQVVAQPTPGGFREELPQASGAGWRASSARSATPRATRGPGRPVPGPRARPQGARPDLVPNPDGRDLDPARLELPRLRKQAPEPSR